MKYIHLLILLCLLCCPQFIYSGQKEDAWNRMWEEVSSWKDSLGHPIDEKVKKAVVALNLLGHQTRQSCEGHLEHSSAYPWIDFVIQPEVDTLINHFTLVREELVKEEELLKTKYPNLTFEEVIKKPEALSWQMLMDKVHQLSKECEGALTAQSKELYLLLNDFYQDRRVDYDCAIILFTYESPRIQSLGAERQEGRSEDERKTKLLEYQVEMNCFADFLKNHYLER